MRILQLSFNSARTFKQNLYGVTIYTKATNRILKGIGDTDLYVVAPTSFYARGRSAENYVSLNFGRLEMVEDGIYIKYMPLGMFLSFTYNYMKTREFYSALFLSLRSLEHLGISPHKYDVVVYEFYSFARALEGLGVPKVYRTHEVYALYRENPTARLLEEYALKTADIIMPPSEDDKEKFIELYGVDEDKIHPVPVPIDGVNEKLIRRRKYEDKETLTALFSGFPHKYNIEAVRFIVKNAEEVPFVKFYICGDFRKEMFREIPKNVEFLGFLSKERYVWLLENVDIAVMPMQHSSGINMRVAEYVRYGLPIVGTPSIGRGYGLRPNEHFIAFNDAESFVEAMEKAKDGEYRKNIIISAVKYVKENLSLEVLVGRVKRLLESLCG